MGTSLPNSRTTEEQQYHPDSRCHTPGYKGGLVSQTSGCTGAITERVCCNTPSRNSNCCSLHNKPKKPMKPPNVSKASSRY